MKRLLFIALSAAALLALAGCGSMNITAQEASDAGASSGSSIAAYPETMHLSAGGQDTIQVSGAQTRDLIWASSDRSVAIVDESGKVTAQGPGNCTVTIASKTDSNVSSHVEVVVEGGQTAAATSGATTATAATTSPPGASTSRIGGSMSLREIKETSVTASVGTSGRSSGFM